MSLWLNLLPQLHRPGVDELNMRHHHFQEEGAQFYDGSVRPQTFQRPASTQTSTTSTTTPTPSVAPASAPSADRSPPGAPGAPGSTTECPPNGTGNAGVPANTINVETLRPATGNAANNQILLRKFASSHYQSYTTALSVTIAVGCFLLLLNILIFFGIYHQRDRTHASEKKRKKKDELGEVGSCSSSSGDGHHFETKHALVDAAPPPQLTPRAASPLMELPLQEFQCSPPPGKRPGSCTSLAGPGTSVAGSASGCGPGTSSNPNLTGCSSTTGSQTHISQACMTSPSIPDPPPPPKGQPPNQQQCNQSNQSGVGILRAQGCPSTPGSTKKRVHIQEISV